MVDNKINEIKYDKLIFLIQEKLIICATIKMKNAVCESLITHTFYTLLLICFIKKTYDNQIIIYKIVKALKKTKKYTKDALITQYFKN